MAFIRKWPTSGAKQFAEGVYIDEAWVNLVALAFDDNNKASITAATFDSPKYSQVAIQGNFGFASGTSYGTSGLPTSPEQACIKGIEVEIRRHGTNGAVGDALVQLTRDGTSGYGINKASSGTWATATGGTSIYGGPNDLWGTRWDHGDVCGTGFGIRWAIQALGADADAYAESVRIVVYYDTLGGVYESPSRSRRIPVSYDKDVGCIQDRWKPATNVAITTVTVGNTAGTGGTASTAWSGGIFSSAGTAEMTIGSAGTVSWANTLGRGQELYFCSTAGTTKAMPTGVTAFAHYYAHTRGSSATSFTFGTSPTGTAGTQINLTGTTGTHSLWIRNP